LLAGVASVHAQSNPSSDQIINSLRPSGPITGLTRGIRPVGPAVGSQTGATPPASAADSAVTATHDAAVAATNHRLVARPPNATVNSTAAAPSVNLTVIFPNGSAQLTPAAVRTLDELGRALSSSTLAGYKFRIEGHTDTVGGADMNKTLSEQRANAVVEFLVSRFSIDRTRLTPVGMGQDGLLIPTPPDTPEPRNRRVQVVNLGT
jgi:outer membrane protein OmpA-like peptidoglycan-associated protein